MNIDTIILFVGIVFLIAIIPGPNALLVLFTALTKSRLQAFSNIAGVSSGFIAHAFISAQGLNLLLTQSVFAFTLLKWLGVAYLVWLGITNIRAGLKTKMVNMLTMHSDNQVGENSEADTWENCNKGEGVANNFIKGFLTNMLNPKIVLFYLSIFPQFVSPQTVFADSMLLGMTQAIVVSSWFLVVILLAEQFKAILTNAKTARWINYAVGSIFLGFGLKLATAKL
ncbi:LysE family translocator [Shewanella sp. D64]|uniref:LysE family translocator n=1 Tax=unclassified Shewanella TaxID=196818 RepID=UPI0022BA332E|nr:MULTISPECIES: LysE family translocator [unclassified Shewanella]MEC4723983.1 LysE family translocator [Shewanella sp. D64]MEC4736003.1 LysE family translocator [Shewanella sp. E94]WBJ93035.1 LysE family translocator [Shewanella sp. MTB7]